MGHAFGILMAHVGALRTFGAPAPLTLGVSPPFSSAAQPMLLQSSVTPSKPYSLGRGRCGGLRLFQIFSAAATRYSGSGSYRFGSFPCTSAQPPWQHGASQAAPVVTLGASFWPSGLTIRCSGSPSAPAELSR